MNRYTVMFSGRRVGAIGIMYDSVVTLDATDYAQMRSTLYERYEHIGSLAVRKVEPLSDAFPRLRQRVWKGARGAMGVVFTSYLTDHDGYNECLEWLRTNAPHSVSDATENQSYEIKPFEETP